MDEQSKNGKTENSSTRRTWRNRLASLVAAVGASLALTTTAPAQANTPNTQEFHRIEMNSQKRLRKLVFRRGVEGNLRVADHTSHESHVSHVSHYSSHS
jgi:hypothetical protein